MNTATIRVAGVTFEKRQNTLQGLRNHVKAGNTIDMVLVRESNNKKDPNAIKVIARWHRDNKLRRAHIGYIPKEQAAQLAPMMDNNTFIKITKFTLSDTKTVGVGMELEWK